MAQTQIEQLKAAKRAYIITLNAAATKFAVHLDAGNGLEVLWPGDAHAKGPKSAELLSGQVHSNLPSLPAYHFHLSGVGYSKVGDIAETLRAHNRDLQVYTLDGWNPHRIA